MSDSLSPLQKRLSDSYSDFDALLARETEGVDFNIELEDRGSEAVVLGIHGGNIEPGTELVVRAIAGGDVSYYLFLGKEQYQHITSAHFNEERCLNLVSRSKYVISIHGKKGAEEFVMLGGLAKDLISRSSAALEQKGFTVLPPEPGVEGILIGNICNKGMTGEGLQIELSRGLRDAFTQSPEKLEAFAEAIRRLVV